MKITNEMMNPEVRLKGSIVRKLFRFKSRETFVRSQKMVVKVRKFMKPRAFAFIERTITTSDNSSLRLCQYQAFETKPNAIGLLWIHGGGYGVGTPEQDIAFMKSFLETANCVIISPDYRLAIDAPYPAAMNDCYAALLWMREHAEELGIREDQLFVGGDSAGGGLSAATVLFARDNGKVNVAFQMPLYPMIDDRMITPSSQDNDAPVWDSAANKVGWQMYLGDLFETDAVPPYAAPARAKNFEGLPPTYTYVGNIEPFYDETKQYIDDLKAAGVQAELDIYPGCFHAFDIMCKNSAVGKQASDRLKKQFKYASEHYFAKQP